jgi:Fe-S-cluster containining protein
LKSRDYGYDPDELAAELHERAFQIIDCTRCANCCKTMNIKVGDDDAARIAEHFGMATDEFVKQYLAITERLGRKYRKFRQKQCPFLGEDNLCEIYELRPTVCREYPPKNRDGFVFSTIRQSQHALHCPAEFWIVEEMRRRSL